MHERCLTKPHPSVLLTLALALVLALVACGDDDGPDTTDTSDASTPTSGTGGGSPPVTGTPVDVTRFCQAFCARAAACDTITFLGGEAGCPAVCMTSYMQNNDACPVADPEACIDATGMLACETTRSGTLAPACACLD